MNNKTEDRFYFGKPEQKTKFGSDTRAVNRQARMWLSQANNAGADEGLEQFHARLIKRLAEIIQSTDELIRNPKKEEDYGGWSYDDLEKELLRVAPHSNVARRWLQSNLRGGRFSRPGQPERFAATVPQKWIRQWENSYEIKVHDEKPGRWTFRNVHDDRSYDITADSFEDAIARLKRIAPSGEYKIGGYQSSEWRAAQRSRRFSSPGQPERFAAQIVSKRGTKRTEIKRDATGKWAAVLIQSNRTGVPGEGADEQVLEMKWYATEANARTAAAKMLSARPGQPDKFDASSLERGSFAEASKSPILGKLLSEKAMPEGGWRAVQAGSDTLVISFEDGDVAGNFARRVAGKGYSATNPVQAIGRYWNVEVKNG